MAASHKLAKNKSDFFFYPLAVAELQFFAFFQKAGGEKGAAA